MSYAPGGRSLRVTAKPRSGIAERDLAARTFQRCGPWLMALCSELLAAVPPIAGFEAGPVVDGSLIKGPEDGAHATTRVPSGWPTCPDDDEARREAGRVRLRRARSPSSTALPPPTACAVRQDGNCSAGHLEQPQHARWRSAGLAELLAQAAAGASTSR
ncbi:MAG: hypothetical protein U1E53_33325 [Dongiaceae bacterium]